MKDRSPKATILQGAVTRYVGPPYSKKGHELSARVTPHAGRNAIAQAQFAIEFAQPVNESVLEDISRRHHEVQNFLPAKQETRGTSVVLFKSMTTMPPDMGGSQPLQAVEFRQFRPDGSVAWSLTAHTQFLTVICSDYSRWDSVWSTVRDLLLRYVTSYYEQAMVSGIGLQYVDRFVIDGEGYRSFAAAQIFREDSPWLPARVFKAEDLWHVHQGAFEPLLEKPWRYLVNVNVDYNDEPVENRRAVVITGFHRALSQSPQLLTADISEQTLQLDDVMPALHEANKKVLQELLNDSARQSIGLEA